MTALHFGSVTEEVMNVIKQIQFQGAKRCYQV